MSDTQNPKCPRCKTIVIINYRSTIGVSYRCINCGKCGLRFDSMTQEEKEAFESAPIISTNKRVK